MCEDILFLSGALDITEYFNETSSNSQSYC